LKNLNTVLFLWLSSGYSAGSKTEQCVFLQEENNFPGGPIAYNVLLKVRRRPDGPNTVILAPVFAIETYWL